MNTRIVTAALALAAAGATGTAVAAPSASDAARGPVTHIQDCAGEPQHRPREITLACADGNLSLTRLRWRNWGSSQAIATGVGIVNMCEPTCVAGKWRGFRVTVVAHRIRNLEATARYQRLLVIAPARRPQGIARREQYRLTAHGPVQIDTRPAAPGTAFTAFGITSTWRAVVSGSVLEVERPGEPLRRLRVTRQAFSRGVDFTGMHGTTEVALTITGNRCLDANGTDTGQTAKLAIGARTLTGCTVAGAIPRADT